MGTDVRKHAIPLAGDTPRRQAFPDLSLSINDIVPVANTTERAQLVADLTSAGAAPSASRPLYVHRQDASGGWELERTVNGTTWVPVRGLVLQGQTAGIVQAWSLVATTSGAGGITVTYPAAFPTYASSVTAQIADASPATAGFTRLEGFSSTSLTSVVVRVYSLTGSPILTSSVRLNMIAIGY